MGASGARIPAERAVFYHPRFQPSTRNTCTSPGPCKPVGRVGLAAQPRPGSPREPDPRTIRTLVLKSHHVRFAGVSKHQTSTIYRTCRPLSTLHSPLSTLHRIRFVVFHASQKELENMAVPACPTVFLQGSSATKHEFHAIRRPFSDISEFLASPGSTLFVSYSFFFSTSK